MPLVGLGTGASAFGNECDEPPPNPPFTNERCFVDMAKRAAADWIGRGGALVETAQDDLNQVPVGAAYAESGVDRSELFLMTKCIGSLSFEGTSECIYDALQMLQTDYLDLVILHGPRRPGACFEGQVGVRNAQSGCTHEVPVGDEDHPWKAYDPGDAGRLESWRALEVAQLRGLTRAIGLSDFSVEQIGPILAKARIPPALLQTNFQMASRFQRPEALKLKAYCDAHGIVTQAWGPLGSPILGRGFDPQEPEKPFLRQVDYESGALRAIAAAHGVSTRQAALRWILESGAAIVVGTGNPEHMRSDAALFGFSLSPAEMAVLDSGAALAHERRPSPAAAEAPAAPVGVALLGLALVPLVVLVGATGLVVRRSRRVHALGGSEEAQAEAGRLHELV